MTDNVFYSSVLTKFVSAENNIIELPDLLKKIQEKGNLLNMSDVFTCTNCIIKDGKVIINEDATYGIIKVEKGNFKDLEYVISYNTWDISETEDNKVIATLDNNGIFTISGTGNMKNYEQSVEIPWEKVKGHIKSVKITDGITSISKSAFIYSSNITDINIPSTLTNIGSHAFLNCRKLSTILIPENVVKIDLGAFHGCDNLTIVCKFNSVAEKYAKGNHVNYVSIINEIDTQTTAEQIKEKIGNEIECEIVNLEGNKVESTSIVGTNYKVKTTDGQEFTIIVRGDFTGDGKISISELARISRVMVQAEEIEIMEELIIDVNEDRKIKVEDLAVLSLLATK